MGTRGIQDPIAADLLDEILAEQANLRNELTALKQASPVFMERASPADLKAPQEGQLIINPQGTHVAALDEPVQYFENGEWRSIAVAAAGTHNMPWMAALGFDESVEHPQGDMPFNWTSAADVNFRGYDYAAAGDKVFDISKSELPGVSPLGIRKAGLYLVSAEIHWEYAWGNLTDVTIEADPVGGALAGMFGWHSQPPSQFNGDASVIISLGEAGDTGSFARPFKLLRKVNSVATAWPSVSGRHLTGGTRSSENLYFVAIQLAQNLGDTHLFNGGVVPG